MRVAPPAAQVMLSDGALAAGEEDARYEELAAALEIPRPRATELLAEVDAGLE